MYDMIVLPLCRVGNIRSAHVVPKRAEQTEEVLLRPLTPLPFPKRAHEKRILHPSDYEEKEGMQQAADTMHNVLGDLDGKAPARPHQHPSCAAAAAAAAAAALFVVSYSYSYYFFVISLSCHMQVAFGLLERWPLL